MKHNPIETLLTIQHSTLTSLIELLTQEKTAIINRQALEIEIIKKEKQVLISNIQKYSYQLEQHQQHLNNHQQWHDIQQLLIRCKQHNELNNQELQHSHLSFHQHQCQFR